MTRRFLRGGTAAAALLAASVLLASCTSTKAGNGTAQGSLPPPSTSSAPSSETPTPTESTTDTVTPSASPTTSAATSSAPASTTPTVKPVPTCAASALAVRVIRGGAALGQEIALITFTNTSAVTCRLTGFPSVQLLRGGQPIGSPSRAATVTPKLVTLAPQAQAESQVTDFSSCQAQVSDTMRITPPGSTASINKPYEMRACTIIVNPVSLSH